MLLAGALLFKEKIPFVVELESQQDDFHGPWQGDGGRYN